MAGRVLGVYSRGRCRCRYDTMVEGVSMECEAPHSFDECTVGGENAPVDEARISGAVRRSQRAVVAWCAGKAACCTATKTIPQAWAAARTACIILCDIIKYAWS